MTRGHFSKEEAAAVAQVSPAFVAYLAQSHMASEKLTETELQQLRGVAETLQAEFREVGVLGRWVCRCGRSLSKDWTVSGVSR